MENHIIYSIEVTVVGSILIVLTAFNLMGGIIPVLTLYVGYKLFMGMVHGLEDCDKKACKRKKNH